MSVSASEIERLESSKRMAVRTRYTEEYRLEAVGYYRKAKEIDPKKTITDCARELGINDKMNHAAAVVQDQLVAAALAAVDVAAQRRGAAREDGVERLALLGVSGTMILA